MTFFQHLFSEVVKKTTVVASSIQRQAPGARMIGEFAVKHATQEAEKIAARIRGRNSSDPQK
jgi:hypothetical protein